MKRILVLTSLIIFAAVVIAYLSLFRYARQVILLVPLDSRPVNTQYAQMLGKLGGAEVILPPPEKLDLYLKPAPADELLAWLEENRDLAGKMVISVNEIINGGLIASRDAASYSDLRSRLDRLATFLKNNKNKDITLLYIVPRHLPSQFTDLWNYREDLARWAELVGRLENDDRQQFTEKEEAFLRVEVSRLERKLPPQILASYKAVYQGAENLAGALFDLTQASLCKELVVGIDDAVPYGLNSRVFERLQAAAAQKGLGERIKFIHGADDLTMLVLARKIAGPAKKASVAVTWLNPADQETIFPYEGVSAGEMTRERVEYLGASLEESGRIAVYIHSQPLRDPAYARSLCDTLQGRRSRDGIIALADIACTNRADEGLLEAVGVDKLYETADAYAGWNTAGNSIGTVLAHGLLLDYHHSRFPKDLKGLEAHRDFQAVRIIDDYLFQGIVRREFNRWAQKEGIDTADFGSRWGEANQKLRELMTPHLQDLGYEKYTVVFPWARSFEIKVTVPVSGQAAKRSS
ncbi:MAG: DUF4127 family protein [Peptococcaceae bacterium]|nr:DUF4127 family protein [Peptococcaceae bacterium]MDH7524190.1 DUF4127 family protein [Peptococcaceae bacterium]